MRDQRGRAACQGVAATGRDSSRQDVHSSHRSQKAMLQPRVHHRRREASTSEAPASRVWSTPVSLTTVWPFPHVRCRARLRQGGGWVSKCGPVLCCLLTALMVFTQSAPLRSETPSDERWQGWHGRGRAWLCQDEVAPARSGGRVLWLQDG